MVGEGCSEINQGFAVAVESWGEQGDFELNVGMDPTSCEELVHRTLAPKSKNRNLCLIFYWCSIGTLGRYYSMTTDHSIQCIKLHYQGRFDSL